MAVAKQLTRSDERRGCAQLDEDRRGRELAEVALDLLDEAVTLTRRVRSQLGSLREVHHAASGWERLIAVSALLRGLDALGAGAWFGGQRLSGAALELGSPALRVAVPEISAVALGLDLRALKAGTPGSMRDALLGCEAALARFTEARDACRSAATRLRWRCG